MKSSVIKETNLSRRGFLKSAGGIIAAVGIGSGAMAAGKDFYYPVSVDKTLFETINRVKNPSNETMIEKLHGPVISAPEKVKSGKPFTVEVSIGEIIHPMGPTHWIEHISLDIGNEPAGVIDLQPRGYLNPKVSFTVMLTKEEVPGGKVTLFVHHRCNLHGYWEGSRDISVV